jgi:hypothetical protein
VKILWRKVASQEEWCRALSDSVDEETSVMTAEVGPWEKEDDDKEGNGTRATKRKIYLVILL